MDLRGRVALVTGGARRVGRAISLALAEQGTSVAVHYNASGDAASSAVQDVREAGVGAAAIQGDLRQPGTAERIVRETEDALGGIDILVNSAAVMLRTPVGEVTVEEWDDMFALNVRAPFLLVQAARGLLARNRGVVINIADLAALEAWPAYVPHGMTKAAVVQMTRGLARVLAPEVRVNAVAPGAVLLPDSWDRAAADRLVATTPLRRLGTPADVAQAVLYLASADYVTGEVLIVDGGRHVRH